MIPLFDHLFIVSPVCRFGGSVVHASIASAFTETNELLLTVDYRARSYANGILPTQLNRRERHGTDEEILAARIIDRAVRPLFPKDYKKELQVIVTNHAADGIHDPITASVNAVSFALMQSNQPWNGPVGCVRVGLVDGQLIVDPTNEQMKSSTLDFLYAGNSNRPLMIETVAKEVPEQTIKVAMGLAQTAVNKIIDTQLGFFSDNPSGSQVALSKRTQRPLSSDLAAEAQRLISLEARAIFSNHKLTRDQRSAKEGELIARTLSSLSEHPTLGTLPSNMREGAVGDAMKKVFRGLVLEGNRVDGRAMNEIRPLSCSHDVLPCVHGSSFFRRGDTHVLSTVTLASKVEAEVARPLNGEKEYDDYFMLHYDFPPYCTGEIGNATAVNRRMIGHGNLAERAIRPVMPDFNSFPYTVRVFAECTSSNGSSSMGSACAASLSLMDAGVPITSPVAAISVGLVTSEDISDGAPVGLPSNPPVSLSQKKPKRKKKGDIDPPKEASTTSYSLEPSREIQGQYQLLTDILGMEDHYGDMDFKVGGTEKGVTAIQMDIKLNDGIPTRILEEALDAAREGRMRILKTMNTSISSSRSQPKPQAPSSALVQFDPERKSYLIGPGGEMIRHIEKLYNCKIDLNEENSAYIFGPNRAEVNEAKSLIVDIVSQVKEGDIFQAEVIDLRDFGVLVRLTRAQEALLHISELTHDVSLQRKPIPELVCKGQRLNVKVVAVDKASGLVKVSRKKLLTQGEKDSLAPEASQIDPIGVLPTFPLTPPRKFNKDFFKSNVASDQEIQAVMKKQEAAKNPPQNPSKPTTPTTTTAPSITASSTPATSSSPTQDSNQNNNSNNNNNNKNSNNNQNNNRNKPNNVNNNNNSNSNNNNNNRNNNNNNNRNNNHNSNNNTRNHNNNNNNNNNSNKPNNQNKQNRQRANNPSPSSPQRNSTPIPSTPSSTSTPTDIQSKDSNLVENNPSTPTPSSSSSTSSSSFPTSSSENTSSSSSPIYLMDDETGPEQMNISELAQHFPVPNQDPVPVPELKEVKSRPPSPSPSPSPPPVFGSKQTGRKKYQRPSYDWEERDDDDIPKPWEKDDPRFNKSEAMSHLPPGFTFK